MRNDIMKYLVLKQINEYKNEENSDNYRELLGKVENNLKNIWKIDCNDFSFYSDLSLEKLINDYINSYNINSTNFVIEKLLISGKRCLGFGNYDKAREYFNKILSVHDGHIDALYNRSLSYIKESLYNEALNDLNKCISIDKHNINFHLYKGFCLWSLNDTNAALLAYQEGLELYPGNELLSKAYSFVKSFLYEKLPNIVSIIQKKQSDPAFIELIKRHSFEDIIETILSKPSSLMSYVGDEKFHDLLSTIMSDI